MTSIILSAIGLILAIAVFVILCMKGTGAIFASVIATMIIAVTANGGFTENFFTVFMTGTMGFMQNMLLLFITGALFGGLLNITGCNDSIGRTLTRVLGQKNVLYIIMVFSMVVAATGASPIIIVAYLAVGLMKSVNMPRYIGMCAMAGTMIMTQNVLPVSGTIGNLIPTMFLGTTIYAAPLMGIIAFAVGLPLNIFYVNWLVKDAKKRGRVYDPMPGEENMKLREETDTPPFILAILPIVFIIVFCFIAVLAFQMDSSQAVIYASLLGALLMLITCGKYIHTKSKFKMLGDTISFMMPIVIGTSIVVGFAAVVANTEVYNAVVGWIMGLNMNPYVRVVIGTTLICILCADCLGGSSSFLALMGEKILAMGANPAAVHRLTSITSTAFDSMPHNGSMCMILMCYGYEHKDGYKYLMISNIAIPMIMSLVAMVVAVVAY